MLRHVYIATVYKFTWTARIKIWQLNRKRSYSTGFDLSSAACKTTALLTPSMLCQKYDKSFTIFFRDYETFEFSPPLYTECLKDNNQCNIWRSRSIIIQWIVSQPMQISRLNLRVQAVQCIVHGFNISFTTGNVMCNCRPITREAIYIARNIVH